MTINVNIHSLEISVPIAAPSTPSLGNIQSPKIKKKFRITFITFPNKVEYIAALVKDKPSANCLNDWKVTIEINENDTQNKYGEANLTTSIGWFIEYRRFLFKKTIVKRISPSIKQIKKLCSKILDISLSFFAPSASAIKGVIAWENPIPIDIAINTKLFPNEIAANSAVPSCPTITLSINWTNVCPSIPIITG